jgi:hypothetical protein
MLVVKHLYEWSYWQTEQWVSRSHHNFTSDRDIQSREALPNWPFVEIDGISSASN